MGRAKIFGIGLSRTGTTSLTEALGMLGFSAIHYPTSVEEIARYEAATDLLVAAEFEALDVQYPGSKFIYTVRERCAWLASCRQHWLRQGTTADIDWELRRRLYRTLDFDPDLFAQAYDRHETRVLHYFAARPDDLLVLDICAGRPDWEKLCAFLGVAKPDMPFPNTNRADSLDAVLIRLLHVIGNAEQVAKIAKKVSSQYVEALRNTEAFRSHQREAALNCDGNHKIDRALARACGYLGGIDAAAVQLQLPRACLEQAIARRRSRKRAKLFAAVRRKLRWLMTRTTG